jgi:hypothetical protein
MFYGKEKGRMSWRDIKPKRKSAGIPGSMLCQKAGIGRSKLSDLENGYVTVPDEEQQRIEAVLDELIAARRKINQLAADLGWTSPEPPV